MLPRLVVAYRFVTATAAAAAAAAAKASKAVISIYMKSQSCNLGVDDRRRKLA